MKGWISKAHFKGVKLVALNKDMSLKARPNYYYYRYNKQTELISKRSFLSSAGPMWTL